MVSTHKAASADI